MTEVYASSFDVRFRVGPDVQDITESLQTVLNRSGVYTGQVTAFMVGSTGSLTTIEYEPGVVEDLKDAINRLAPAGLDYAHERAWHDGNGHSHVQAALLGPSIALPVRRSQLTLGAWQQVVAINHDNCARERTVEVTVIGNTKDMD